MHEAFRYGSGREWGIGASAPFVAGFLSAPANAGALIAPKKHDLQGVASRAFLHVAAVHPSRCEGERYFLSGSDRAAFLPGHCQNSSFLRPEGSPHTRCLQAILIQSSDPAFCRAMNPGNIFLEVPSGTMFMMKKFTPAGRGTLKKFFQKYFPEPLRRFSGRERPPMPIPEERAAAPCSLQNVSVPYEYQKGSEGNV